MIQAPSISGDTLDYKSNKILIGSHLDKRAVQILDYNKREFFCDVDCFVEGEVSLEGERKQYLLRAVFAEKTELFDFCGVFESKLCETFGTEKE